MRDLFKSLDAFKKIKETNLILKKFLETDNKEELPELTFAISHIKPRLLRPATRFILHSADDPKPEPVWPVSAPKEEIVVWKGEALRAFLIRTKRLAKKKIKPRVSLNQIKISLASPEQIKRWCSRLLPTGETVGEIKNAQTIHYKTLRPISNGLFCQQIFGPVADFICSCGISAKDAREEAKKVRKKYDGFCYKCHVEYTKARVRRYNLGYIKLNSPVTHIWFLKGRVSYISILLGWKRKQLEDLTFCQKFVHFPHQTRKNSFFSSPLLFKSLPLNGCKFSKKVENDEKPNPYCFGFISLEVGKGDAEKVYPGFSADLDHGFFNIKSNTVQTEVEMKTFLQPTICPFLPAIVSHKLDFRRVAEVPLFYYKGFYQPEPVWHDLICLLFFTVLPGKRDIPIPDYSQLTSKTRNSLLQHHTKPLLQHHTKPLLQHNTNSLPFHKKHLFNAGAKVIKKRLKFLNLPVKAEILKSIIFKAEKEHNRLIPIKEYLSLGVDLESCEF